MSSRICRDGFMQRYLGYLLLTGLVFFLGREAWLNSPKIVVMPDLAVIRVETGETYGFGNPEQLKRYQPFGYFFDKTDLSVPVYWAEDFAVIVFKGKRIFWFGPDFSWTEISKLPVSLDSDIWLVSENVDFGDMPPSKDKIVWLHPHKRLPKKFKEIGVEIIDAQKAGIVTLELMD